MLRAVPCNSVREPIGSTRPTQRPSSEWAKPTAPSRAWIECYKEQQRTPTTSVKLIDQLKARTDEFTAATNKTMNAINPMRLWWRHACLRHRCKCRRLDRAAVTAGVLAAGVISHARAATQGARGGETIFKKFTGPMAPPDGNGLEERVGDMERRLGETRATLQERVTAVRVLRGLTPSSKRE